MDPLAIGIPVGALVVAPDEKCVGLRRARGQLRSSRTTRNQDHTPRNRAGIPDFDPTEGLPVRRWEQTTVRISQDASTETTVENSRDPATSQDGIFSFPPLPLPSFFGQISTHNQELLRRSRLGNVDAKLSIWDPKTNSYIAGIELERRELARKAALNNPKLSSSNLNLADENTHPLDDDDDKQDDEADDLLDADGLPEKRRKTTSGSNERIIEVKKWVQVPLAVAEKMPEPKYLADRRPGMESLYKGAYKATNGFGTLGDMVSAAMSGGNTGYDLGEAPGTLAGGTGSANANSGLGQSQLDGGSTPVRKNIPPRRKKKGGPGRRPKNWKPPTDPNTAPTTENTTTENTTGATTGDGGDTTMKDTPAASGERIDTTNTGPAVQSEANNQDEEGEGEGEGSSESEGEGSEEGEIAPANDVPETETQAEPVVEPVVDEPERAPETQEEVMEVVEEVVTSVDAAPVEEAAVETKEDVASNVEMDVLGALEAALDKEAGESV
ncbi:hypothetical protein H2200_008002 [Cladophialophora chaetospira]|uniref:Uncharacterized protein n=1 Tax=Cladophialophora chaetospira TaxID=386627 RepID=A0AA38X6Y8_9EURO|nr:hypothetical protein H2200_008002 [Cladophialophora chaetospira]